MADLTAMLQAAAGASAGGDYQISRSLRFNSADSAYLSRTPASAGNRKTWTWSGWVKRSTLASAAVHSFFGACDASVGNSNWLGFVNDSLAFIVADGNSGNVITSAVYRDVSAWYHIVMVYDSTQATASNRQKIYVNGVQVTVFSASTYVSQNLDGFINSNVQHGVGARIRPSGTADLFFPGYLTDINFIDGQALTPSSFGEVDDVTGVWKPIRYAGTYGTNGFHLDFSDNSSTTALGYDAAGSNDWTPNNFSVTAGAGNDSLVDTPTPYGDDTGAGGEVRGNYATLNPLNLPPSNNTISNGNLENNCNVSGQFGAATSTISVSSGKWYAEFTVNAVSGTPAYAVGISTTQFQNERLQPNGYYGNFWYYSYGYAYISDGRKYTNNSDSAYGATYTSGDVIGVALDLDAGTVVFYKNGVSQGTAFSGLSGTFTINTAGLGVNSRTEANFGQRPFAYTAPSGFKALVTTNLPEPTVVQGDDYFNTVLYTGDRTDRTITVGFQPDFVWVKSRNAVDANYLMNSLSGVGKYLVSDSTAAEATNAPTLTAFDSTGFSVGNTGTTNETGRTYASWSWKGGGAGVSNTDGTITSTVSANTTAGISIVTYTGNGTAGATVGHGLSAPIKMLICKQRDGSTYGWNSWHTSLNEDSYIALNSTGGQDNSVFIWDTSGMTSSVFTHGSSTVYMNNTGYTYVAYCFAEVEGFSKFGSYTGNGSADGPFVYTNFRPAFVLIKKSSSSSYPMSWNMFDSKRNTFNVVDKKIYANESDAERTTVSLDFLSNGFKMRVNDALYENESGATYIYACFAEVPFRNSLAR
jgi:hypothetical protein